jgi:hypothetical protein
MDITSFQYLLINVILRSPDSSELDQNDWQISANDIRLLTFRLYMYFQHKQQSPPFGGLYYFKTIMSILSIGEPGDLPK